MTSRFSATAECVLNEAARIMKGVGQGRTYDPQYFVGVTMAVEQVLKGEDEAALQLFKNALTHDGAPQVKA